MLKSPSPSPRVSKVYLTKNGLIDEVASKEIDKFQLHRLPVNL